MLLIISAAASAAWLLALLAGMSAARSPRPRAGSAATPGDAATPGIDEPPALVSLLAGNLDACGYPATLLDLAARGWLRLAVYSDGLAAGGPVMCTIASPPHDQLTRTNGGCTTRSCPAPLAVATSRPAPCPTVSPARPATT